MDTGGLPAFERRAYVDRLSDGIIDLAGGVALTLVGATWLLAEDRAWIAILAIPPLAALTVPLRSRLVESRGGYVRFSLMRRRREHRTLLGLVALGAAALAIAFVLTDVAEGRSLLDALAPGILGLLVALPITAVGIATGVLRFVGYGAVALTAAVATIAVKANPGWPLAVAGVVAIMVGAGLAWRFARRNPPVARRRAT